MIHMLLLGSASFTCAHALATSQWLLAAWTAIAALYALDARKPSAAGEQ